MSSIRQLFAFADENFTTAGEIFTDSGSTHKAGLMQLIVISSVSFGFQKLMKMLDNMSMFRFSK